MSDNHDIPPGYNPPSYSPQIGSDGRPAHGYRDPESLPFDLDMIRVAERDAAEELYRACLQCAYQQGRAHALAELLRRIVK